MNVSLIIPVYKVEATIRRCLQSVADQRFDGSVECIIVDDASPDGSMAIVDEFIAATPEAASWKRLVHERNSGLSAARNSGMRIASGDYLLFLDSDDELPPCALSRLVELARKYPGVDIVQGNVELRPPSPGLDFDIRRHHFPEFTAEKAWIKRHMLTDIPVMAWNKLMRRQWVVANEFSFKEGILHEDEHWRYLIFDKVGSIAFCSDVTYIYYMVQGSITHVARRDRSAMSMLGVYNEFFNKIDEPSHWLHVLRVLCGYTLDSQSLEAPERFIPGFRSLAERVFARKGMPANVRMAYGYLLYQSHWRLMYLKLFHHTTYGILRRLLRDFRSPLVGE